MNEEARSGVDGAGDLGRRVRERRTELGLSLEAVAKRAGMDASYLEYAEENVATLSTVSLLRLAAALETTPEALAGGGIERPPGRARAAGRPLLEELTREECLALLGEGGVGRVVFVGEQGPSALPVNFGLADDAIVFRTVGDGVIAEAVQPAGATVAFEVDHVDEALSEGWSVLVRGQARAVADEGELARVRGLEIEPWAGGERGLYVRVESSELTGRRIRMRR